MQELKSLTGVRGIAALWVALLHLGNELAVLVPGFVAFAPIYSRGHIGVDLFFVLSGFIISYVYSSIEHWGPTNRARFVVKRFARIYPVHLVTLVGLAGLVLAAKAVGRDISGNYGALDFVYHIFLLQGFPVTSGAWNYPSWSISAEFFGYLVIFPITILLFRKPGFSRQGLLICLVVMGTYVATKVAGIWGPWNAIAKISFEFLAGAALFYGLRTHRKTARRIGSSLPLVVLAGVVVCYLPESAMSDSIARGILVFLCPFVIAGLSSDEGVVCRILEKPTVRYLGLISYSLYMSHAIVEKVLKVLLPVSEYAEEGLLVRGGVFVASIAAVLLVAAALFHLCEEPARKLIQRRTLRWTQPVFVGDEV